MITDRQTNTVFFSKRLTWSTVWPGLKAALEENEIRYELLGNTRDKWARDYMPIQIEKDNFVSYVYNPDYLLQDRHLITYFDDITNLPEVDVKHSTQLIIDGGNIVKGEDYVIMTDKVFIENERFNVTREEVMRELERLFGNVIIIPWNREDEWDFCGHADGIVRHIRGRQVLLNNLRNHPEKAWQRDAIIKIFRGKGIEYEELDYGPGYHGVNDWAYLNFLQVGDVIFMPTVEKPNEDLRASEQLCAIYGCKVVPVPFLPVVKANGKYGGGAINCVSWNILL